MTGLSLNPTDVDNVVRAVRVAAKRGAYEMEESAQLIHSVQNLEAWLQELVDARARVEEDRPEAKPETPGQK
jgi:hypothetical protein